MMIWDKGTSEVRWLSWATTNPPDALTAELKPWLDAGEETLWYIDTDELPRMIPEMPRWLRRIAPAWLVKWWHA